MLFYFFLLIFIPLIPIAITWIFPNLRNDYFKKLKSNFKYKRSVQFIIYILALLILSMVSILYSRSRDLDSLLFDINHRFIILLGLLFITVNINISTRLIKESKYSLILVVNSMIYLAIGTAVLFNYLQYANSSTSQGLIFATVSYFASHLIAIDLINILDNNIQL